MQCNLLEEATSELRAELYHEISKIWDKNSEAIGYKQVQMPQGRSMPGKFQEHSRGWNKGRNGCGQAPSH